VSKFVQTSYSNTKDILKFPDHFVALAIRVSDAGVAANAEGKKIVPAGTILGGGFLANESVLAVKTNGVGAEGVLLSDTDVTYGPASGAAVIHGFINSGKLPEAPAAEAVTALKQITFLK
jgi:hypothetical protein